uniref:Putative rasgap sh3 binding protein rasputin n=1 Tax=Xenopsylla cheopis TaxID=163159 RepID=A0A6M2DTV1_XENCH
MVMDVTPSPQCVGREFVRQYYTLLNKAPTHLHRFYNNYSSFVHGGLDSPNRDSAPVIGQKQIHNKIQQLNFRDCHAKITQVDSQATLGDGVVVQVTGELSNAGQPMRRFTQTFVLASQSPKKYYVHNDIFRYQDLVFNDDDVEADSSRSEGDEDVESEPSCVATSSSTTLTEGTTSVSQSLTGYYSTKGGANNSESTQQNFGVTNNQSSPQVNGISSEEAGQKTGVSESNSAEILESFESIAVSKDTSLEQETVSDNPSSALSVESASDITFESTEIPSKEEITPPAQVSSEPKTYANLVKTGTGSAVSFSSATNSTSSHNNVSRKSDNGTATNATNQQLRDSVKSPKKATVQQPRVLPPRNERGQNMGSRNADGDHRRGGGNSTQYNESYQLFLGNLPHNATEEELKQLFTKFGPVHELRIHSKPSANAKMSNGRVPNYGFITFEDPQSVANCLASKGVYFPEGSPDGQKLNVEEKKPRTRSNTDTRTSDSSNSSRQRGSSSGQNSRSGGSRGGAGQSRQSAGYQRGSGGGGGGGGPRVVAIGNYGRR